MHNIGGRFLFQTIFATASIALYSARRNQNPTVAPPTRQAALTVSPAQTAQLLLE
jgi:hypothetical protein